MSDWIGLAVIVLLLVAAFFGLARLGAPREEITPEEFEKRVQEARGTTRAGAFAGLYSLQKLLNPKAAEAVEVLRDMKAGHYNDQQKKGDDDDTDDTKSDGPDKSDGEKTDA